MKYCMRIDLEILFKSMIQMRSGGTKWHEGEEALGLKKCKDLTRETKGEWTLIRLSNKQEWIGRKVSVVSRSKVSTPPIQCLIYDFCFMEDEGEFQKRTMTERYMEKTPETMQRTPNGCEDQGGGGDE